MVLVPDEGESFLRAFIGSVFALQLLSVAYMFF